MHAKRTLTEIGNAMNLFSLGVESSGGPRIRKLWTSVNGVESFRQGLTLRIVVGDLSMLCRISHVHGCRSGVNFFSSFGPTAACMQGKCRLYTRQAMP